MAPKKAKSLGSSFSLVSLRSTLSGQTLFDSTTTGLTVSHASAASSRAEHFDITAAMDTSVVANALLVNACTKRKSNEAIKVFFKSYGSLRLQLQRLGDTPNPFDDQIPPGSDGMYRLNCLLVKQWGSLTLMPSKDPKDTFLTSDSAAAWESVRDFLQGKTPVQFEWEGLAVHCMVLYFCKSKIEIGYYDTSREGWEANAAAEVRSYAKAQPPADQTTSTSTSTSTSRHRRRSNVSDAALTQLSILTDPSSADLRMTTVWGALPSEERATISELGSRIHSAEGPWPIYVLRWLLKCLAGIDVPEQGFEALLCSPGFKRTYHARRTRTSVVGKKQKYAYQLKMAHPVVSKEWTTVSSQLPECEGLRLWLTTQASGVVHVKDGIDLFCACQRIGVGVKQRTQRIGIGAKQRTQSPSEMQETEDWLKEEGLWFPSGDGPVSSEDSEAYWELTFVGMNK